MKRKEGCPEKSRGFTLIEVLLAVMILGLVVTTVYAAFTGTLRIVRDAGSEGEIYELARGTFDRMARDLAVLAPYRGDYEFRTEPFEIGKAQFTRLSFRSRGHISFPEDDLSGGVSVITYDIVPGPQEEAGGYVLLRLDTLDQVKGEGEASIGGFPLCRGIKALSFAFTDREGKDRDEWDSRQGKDSPAGQVPVSVLVVLEMVNPRDSEQPFRFMTRIFLPVSQGAL